MSYNQNDFLLERYKYVLQRKQHLNEATFKIAAIFQTVLLALGIGQYNVVSLWKQKTIDIVLAKLFTNCILAMLIALTGLVITLISGGIVAWLKYRADESDIEFKVSGTRRPEVKLKSVLRWYETYFLLIVVIVLAAWLYTYIYHLKPMLT
ncbi:hypothetical protein ACFH11_000077 [Enterobacter asburiae]